MKELTLERRIAGSALTRFLQELFGNSAQFPVANILFELLLEGPHRYLTAPDAYAISLAALVQAHYLSRSRAGPMRTLWGNLIGPALYTAIEFSIEGSVFFASPNHIAYWIYAAAIGALRVSRIARPGTHAYLVQVIENIARASILLTMYFIFEMAGRPDLTLANLFNDRSHRFIALATLLLGLSVGLADVTVNTAKRLESSAGPGEVPISATVAEHVPDAARLGTLRLVAAKGKQLPIEVFPVLQ